MNHERKKERHPHLYKDINVYNNLPYEVSDKNMDEIIDELIEEKLINLSDDIIVEVEINNEEKIIEIEFNTDENSINLEEVKKENKKVVAKKSIQTPIKKLDKNNIKKPLKKA
jgi:hypothetical protein